MRALTTQEKEHFHQVYQAGANAYINKEARGSNPHEVLTHERACWTAGYEDQMALNREIVI